MDTKIFTQYNDLEIDIEVLNEQIDILENEIENWWIGGRLFSTVSMDVAAQKVDRLKEKQLKLQDELEEKMYELNRIKAQLKRYNGLKYKVFYKKYIEGKKLTEIAEEVNYSYQWVKEVHAKMLMEM